MSDELRELGNPEMLGLWLKIRRCASFLVLFSLRLMCCMRQAAPFKAIMRSAQHFEKISRVRVKDHVVAPFVPAYQVRPSVVLVE